MVKLHASAPEDKADQLTAPSAWEPLRQPVFRALWIATVVSNVGTWMQNVGAAWLMTTLSPSPLMVALVQSATSFPIFLLGLPAGALADVVDRRRLLLLTQAWMVFAAATLGALTLSGVVTPWLLLALTFFLGAGAALNAPAWQAIFLDLVERPLLSSAIALNSVGYNLARVVGPALAGFVIAGFGAGVTFLLNALSFLGVIGVLYRWRSPSRESILPAERVIGAVRAGLRYVRYSPPLHAVFLRAGSFMFCASALWALMPLVAGELGHGPASYGVLLGSLGLGAVAGSVLLPKLRQKIALDNLVGGATLVFAASTLALAYFRTYLLLCPAMGAGGVAWIFLMASLNVAAQTAVPAWVRARALAAFILVFQGGMAAGSAFWGAFAEHWGVPRALLFASLGLAAGVILRKGWPLGGRGGAGPHAFTALARTSSGHKPAPGRRTRAGDRRVSDSNPSRSKEFVKVMKAWSRVRRRDGAVRWGLFYDAGDPGLYVETFLLDSWAEHLRQHARVTVADLELERQVRAFHIGEKPPAVSHLVRAAAESGGNREGSGPERG